MPNEPDAPLSQRPFTTRQRNQIFELVSKQGLDPSDFEFKFVSQQYLLGAHLSDVREVVIFHAPTHYRYHFTHVSHLGDLDEIAEYAPGWESKTAQRRVYDWDGHLRTIEQWLTCLRREIETPDLWQEWKRATPVVEMSKEAPNSPFTDAEAAVVRRELQSLRDRVGRLPDLSNPDRAWINARFDSLDREVSRLGRLDWRAMLIGVLMEIGLTKILSQVQWAEIVKLAGQLIHRLFGGPWLPVP